MLEAQAKSKARLAQEKAALKKKAAAALKKQAEEKAAAKLAARPWSQKLKFWQKNEPAVDADGKPLLADFGVGKRLRASVPPEDPVDSLVMGEAGFSPL